MSVRRRLALLSGLAVALTVLLASVLVYTLVRDRLRGDIDHDLRDQANRAAQRFQTGPPSPAPGVPVAPPPQTDASGLERGERYALTPPPPEPGGPQELTQLISSNGAVTTGPDSSIQIPVSTEDRQLAANGGEGTFEDVRAGGSDLRVLTQPLSGGTAIQVARSLEDTDRTLNTLIIILAAVSAG